MLCEFFLQVSDVNDDVRRVAVTALGFILFRLDSCSLSAIVILYVSHNNPCFPGNIAITNFLVCNTCEIS